MIFQGIIKWLCILTSLPGWADMRGVSLGWQRAVSCELCEQHRTEQGELLWCPLAQGSLLGSRAGVCTWKSSSDLGLNIQKSLSSGSGFQIWSQSIREEKLPVWVVVCKRTFEYLVLPRK